MTNSEDLELAKFMSGFDLEESPTLEKFRNLYSSYKNNKDVNKRTFQFILLGMLLHGHLDVIDEFLSYLPPLNQQYRGGIGRKLWNIFVSLFPLPIDLADYKYVKDHSDELTQWFHNNVGNLAWDRNIGIYRFKK
jgi:hypothetical protein